MRGVKSQDDRAAAALVGFRWISRSRIVVVGGDGERGAAYALCLRGSSVWWLQQHIGRHHAIMMRKNFAGLFESNFM